MKKTINSTKSNAKVNKALQPDEKGSVFKCKIYFVPKEGYGGQLTQWSFDYAHERQMFEGDAQHDFFKKMALKNPEGFREFNGYQKMLIFMEKLANQGKLKLGIIYLNRVYTQASLGSEFMPMELLRLHPADSTNEN